MSCDNLYCNFFYIGGKRVWHVNGMERIVRVYQRSPEPDMKSKVLQAGLGIDHCSIDYLTPAVPYFARNWQMVQERTLHTLAGGRKEIYLSDFFKHPTMQHVLLDRRAVLSLRFAPNVKFYV